MAYHRHMATTQPGQSRTLTVPAVPEFTLGDRLRKAREFSGMDMQELAAAIDVHRQSISRYESGSAIPRKHVILSWSLVTGVDPEWIQGGAASSTNVEQTSGTTDCESKAILHVNSRGIPRISFL